MTAATLAYVRERLPIALVAIVVAALDAAAFALAGVRPTPWSMASLSAVAALLFAQYRLWDDLEDRERDRASHPDRVTVRHARSAFVPALVIAGAAALVVPAWLGARAATIAIASLDAAFWIAYSHIRPRIGDRAWRFAILLLKYPAFVTVLAAMCGPVSPWRAAIAAIVVYAGAVTYEALHDRRPAMGAAS